MKKEDAMQNEHKTIQYMVEDFCKYHHSTEEELCEECKALAEYAHQRIDKCPFQENKPNCADCKIHCYKPEMRKKVIEVMRFSGPRMALKHPVLAARHLARSIKHKQK